MIPLLKQGMTTLLLLGASHVSAGGLWLNEVGDFAGGRASAGASAGTDEATTIIHNPASAGRIQGKRLQVAAGLIVPTVKFDIRQSAPILGDDNGGDAGKNSPITSFAYVHDLDSEQWSLGVSMAGLAGAGLGYNDSWVGRYQNTSVELLLVGVAIAIAYQVTDKFALGLAPQVYYSTLDFQLRAPIGLTPDSPTPRDGTVKLDGDDSGFSYAAGVSYQFSEQTRIGMTYQSKIHTKYSGNLKLNPIGLKAKSDTDLPFAATIRGGLHHDISDRLGLNLSVGWDDWSTLDSVIVSVDTLGGAGLAKRWRDTYHYALGLQYTLDDDWDLTTGIAYDTSPVKARDRTADLPVDEQMRFNAGARYHISNTATVGGYINYTDLGAAKIDRPFWSGKYSSNEFFSFAVFGEWRL